MRRKTFGGIILASAIILAGCGNSAAEEESSAAVSATEEVVEISSDTEAVPTAADVSEAAEATEVTEETTEPVENEYPSIGKVNSDVLYSLIDKDELDAFALDYYKQDLEGTAYAYSEYEEVGSIFVSFGVPGTEYYNNELVYLCRAKRDDSSSCCDFSTVSACNLKLKDEKTFEDFQFTISLVLEPTNDTLSWPKDDAEFLELTKTEAVDYPISIIANNIAVMGEDEKSMAILEAYVNGSLDLEIKTNTDKYDEFFSSISVAVEEKIREQAKEAFPDAFGVNTGTFSQGK